MLPLLFHPSSSACSSSCFSLQMKEFRREKVVLCRLNMVGSKGPKPILIEFILFVNTLSWHVIELITIVGKILRPGEQPWDYHTTLVSAGCRFIPIPVTTSSFHQINYQIVGDSTYFKRKWLTGSSGDVFYLQLNNINAKYILSIYLSLNNLYLVLWLWRWCWLLWCCCYNLAPEEELGVQGDLKKNEESKNARVCRSDAFTEIFGWFINLIK